MDTDTTINIEEVEENSAEYDNVEFSSKIKIDMTTIKPFEEMFDDDIDNKEEDTTISLVDETTVPIDIKTMIPDLENISEVTKEITTSVINDEIEETTIDTVFKETATTVSEKVTETPEEITDKHENMFETTTKSQMTEKDDMVVFPPETALESVIDPEDDDTIVEDDMATLYEADHDIEDQAVIETELDDKTSESVELVTV